MKKNKLILMVMIIIGSSLAFIIFFILIFHKSFAVSLESGTKVASNTDLTYYIDVIYDGVDASAVASSDTATANVNSDYIYVEDKLPDGLTFKNFVTTSDGTSDEVLQKGVGHVEGSSLPVGGETTHSVLSAHSGLPSARLFTDLNQLRNGDMFYIYVLDQVLAYKVDQVLVVEPSDVEALSLQEGKDYVTLVTCTPYAINTHRLLVRGTRVEYNPEVLENTPVEKELGKDQIILYLSLGLVVVILLFVLFFVIRSKKKTKKDTSITNNVISSEVINTSVDAVNTMNSVSEVPVNNNLIDASEDVNSREMVKTVASDDNVTFNNEVSVSDVSSEENTNDTNNTDDIDII